MKPTHLAHLAQGVSRQKDWAMFANPFSNMCCIFIQLAVVERERALVAAKAHADEMGSEIAEWKNNTFIYHSGRQRSLLRTPMIIRRLDAEWSPGSSVSQRLGN